MSSASAGDIKMPSKRNSIILVTNIAKFLIDLPFFFVALVTILFESLIRNYTRTKKSLDSKDKILVTGAASGIGQQAVYKLAKLFPDAVFILWDINEKALEETATNCRQKCGARSVHTFVVDLSLREDVIRNAAKVRETVGKVTILWNNAGISTHSTFLEGDSELDEKIFKVNLLSYMWTIREFLPEMVEDGKGHLVTTCSALGFYRWSHLSTYVTCKYGMRGFLNTLKHEMSLHPKKPDITFSTFYPGFVNTPMTDGVSWEPRYQIDGVMPMEMEQVADEIVEGILLEKEEIRIPWLLLWACELGNSLLPSKCLEFYDNTVYRNMKYSDKTCLKSTKMLKGSLKNINFSHNKVSLNEGMRGGSG